MKLGVEAALVDGGLVPGDVEIVDGRIARVGVSSPNGRGRIAAPAAPAASIAPITYGVRPLALIPITASVAPTPSECTSRRPASASSSAASCSSDEGASAPARRATTCPGAAENVASHSEASTAASRPDEPAPT